MGEKLHQLEIKLTLPITGSSYDLNYLITDSIIRKVTESRRRISIFPQDHEWYEVQN